MTYRPILLIAFLLPVAACRTPLEDGERLYREGDRLGALETWRAVREDDPQYGAVRQRVAVVEDEFEQLVERYKQRGRYFEERGHLAESILDYRLALKLQPGDAATLEKVQGLARRLRTEKAELETSYREAFESADLPAARRHLEQLRVIDPFDPGLENDERQLETARGEEVERRLARGRKAFTAGRHVAARRELRSVLALDPSNESARGYLAYLATLEREPADARNPVELPDPFASDARVRAEGFYQNALVAEESGDDYGAIRLDVQALRTDPQHRRAKLHLAQLRARRGDDVDPLIEQGREAFQNEDLRSALDSWRMALLIEPENQRARAYVSRAERQLADLESLRSVPSVGADE